MLRRSRCGQIFLLTNSTYTRTVTVPVVCRCNRVISLLLLVVRYQKQLKKYVKMKFGLIISYLVYTYCRLANSIVV